MQSNRDERKEPNTADRASQPNEHDNNPRPGWVPAWMIAAGIEPSNSVTLSKQQLRSMMRPTRELVAQVWAYGMLHSNGYGDQTAHIKKKNKAVRPVTPADIRWGLWDEARAYYRGAGITDALPEKETKQHIRRALERLEIEGMAERRTADGRPLADLPLPERKAIKNPVLVFWAKPRAADPASVQQQYAEAIARQKANKNQSQVAMTWLPNFSIPQILKALKFENLKKCVITPVVYQQIVERALEPAKLAIQEILTQAAADDAAAPAPAPPEPAPPAKPTTAPETTPAPAPDPPAGPPEMDRKTAKSGSHPMATKNAPQVATPWSPLENQSIKKIEAPEPFAAARKSTPARTGSQPTRKNPPKTVDDQTRIHAAPAPAPPKFATGRDAAKAIYKEKTGVLPTVKLWDEIEATLTTAGRTWDEYVESLQAGRHIENVWKNPPGFMRSHARKLTSAAATVSSPQLAEKPQCKRCGARNNKGAIFAPDQKTIVVCPDCSDTPEWRAELAAKRHAATARQDKPK